MKNKYLRIIAMLFIAFFFFLLLITPVFSGEMEELSGLLLANITIEDYIELKDLQSEWLSNNPPMPFGHTLESVNDPGYPAAGALAASASYSRLLVLAEQGLYGNPQAKEKIDRYVTDIGNAFGCTVILETVSGGAPSDIKTILKNYYASGLNGAIFIGRIVPAMYEVPNDHYWWEGGYGYATWPCELYYMDLDGTWNDNDGNGRFDDHIAGSGDKSPEIFTGRIDPRSMGDYGAEAALLGKYLDKNHEYWSGNTALTQSGLIYTEQDFVSSDSTDLNRVYASITHVEYPNTSKSDWLTNRCQAVNGMVQCWTHGSWDAQSFTGGSVTTAEVVSARPQWLGLNLISCSVANWVAGNDRRFICGGYVYNDSARALVSVGSSKTGGMLSWASFYDSVSLNNPVGQALADWFTYCIDNYTRISSDYGYILGWFYGMQIVGDPMIAFKSVTVPASTPIPTAAPTAGPTGVPTVAPTQQPQGLRGDVNGNNTVDIVDALLIAQYYVGLNPQVFNTANADANCSGSIDIVDALLVAQYYVGLISQFC